MATPTTNAIDVPLPAGATAVGEWRLNGGMWRPFRGTERVTVINRGDDVHVGIAGDQDRDGSIDTYISLNGDHFLDAAEARALAADLLAAADEIDALQR